jgi:hypothetical protein
MKIAEKLKTENDDEMSKELYDTCKSILDDEDFVKSFMKVANKFNSEDRLSANKLFDILPVSLDGDIRIQNMRFMITPPKTWSDKSVVIYCGKGNGEEWAYPSIYKGIGGSETAIIRMGEELTKLGYEVTVYNHCGEMAGNYNGVEYTPYFKFNQKDYYNVLIGWRIPSLFHTELKAKKKLIWLHDLWYAPSCSEKAIRNTDKFIFLSKNHRDDATEIPEEKVYYSSNGIVV